MNKKTNKLISNWVMPIVGIGILIITIRLIFYTNFVPDIGLCVSYPNILCELPVIRLAMGMLSLRFAAFMLLHASLVIPVYFIFNRLGFKETDRPYKETKEDKKKSKKYGIYAAIIFVPIYILFLIFYAD